MTSNSCLSEFIIYSCISNKRKWFIIETPRDSISVCLSEFWSMNSNCALRYCSEEMNLDVFSGVLDLHVFSGVLNLHERWICMCSLILPNWKKSVRKYRVEKSAQTFSLAGGRCISTSLTFSLRQDNSSCIPSCVLYSMLNNQKSI